MADKPEIIVYCNPHCGPCMALKEWLHSMGIPFTSVAPTIGAGVRRLPTIEVGGKRVEGFNRPLILELLRVNGY